MTHEHSSEETSVVATYSNRQDAEVVKGFLGDHGIDSFIVADDVYPPLQLTEGVRILVLSSELRRARDALADADLGSSERITTRGEARGGHRAAETYSDGLRHAIGRPARLTSWAYIALFTIVLALIVVFLMGATPPAT